MPLWFMATPSETETVVNGTGTAPPAATPSRALSAWGPSDIEQGVFSPCVLTMPTRGLSRSSSVRPQDRIKARCGVRSIPSTTLRERSSGFLLTSAFLVRTKRHPTPSAPHPSHPCIEPWVANEIKSEHYQTAGNRSCPCAAPPLEGRTTAASGMRPGRCSLSFTISLSRVPTPPVPPTAPTRCPLALAPRQFATCCELPPRPGVSWSEPVHRNRHLELPDRTPLLTFAKGRRSKPPGS